jgi:hypothetical protein
VPSKVHAKLSGLLAPRYGHDREQAKAALLAWYPQVWKRLPATFVMPDAFRFWQAQFDADFADAPPTSAKRDEPRNTVPGADATAKYLAELRDGTRQAAI